jgi:polyphosphate:AMP phosphotransferase
MFESAEVGHAIDKKTFKQEEEKLRPRLLAAQEAARDLGKFPIVLLISGVDGAGKSETITMLHEWMDPRYISTVAFTTQSDEERERPFMWRYWRALPARGRTGIFSPGSWYSIPIARRIEGDMSRGKLDTRLDEINRFEQMLVNEDAVLLKFWFHLTEEGQKKRLHKLEKDPRTAWRVTKESWARTRTYDDLQEVAGHVLRTTNSTWAPWSIVDGTDDHYRHLRVAKELCEAIEKRLAEQAPAGAKTKAPKKRAAVTSRAAPPGEGVKPIDDRNVLTALDLSKSLSSEKGELDLAKWQGRLSELSRHKRFGKHAVVLAFEGMDAAGKGGAIRRLAAALDPRQYQIVPIAAPSEEERAQPYLWRFWRHIPRKGRVTIFDRSWYGRVLVERVEGFCPETDWRRAYAEINDFEHELVQAGVIMVKFWLQIDPKEQLARFKERERVEHKRFKITPDDWRNRKKWDEYQAAAVEMIDRTSTGKAPWVPVEANDKHYARVKIAKTVVKQLEEALDA